MIVRLDAVLSSCRDVRVNAAAELVPLYQAVAVRLRFDILSKVNRADF